MRNIRSMDRLIRALVGLGLLEVGYFWLGSPWNWGAYGVGVVLLLTALTSRCPLYSLLGVSPLPAHTGDKRPRVPRAMRGVRPARVHVRTLSTVCSVCG